VDFRQFWMEKWTEVPFLSFSIPHVPAIIKIKIQRAKNTVCKPHGCVGYLTLKNIRFLFERYWREKWFISSHSLTFSLFKIIIKFVEFTITLQNSSNFFFFLLKHMFRTWKFIQILNSSLKFFLLNWVFVFAKEYYFACFSLASWHRLLK
jgi:glycosyltransferase involved in cell wall biosynthesis